MRTILPFDYYFASDRSINKENKPTVRRSNVELACRQIDPAHSNFKISGRIFFKRLKGLFVAGKRNKIICLSRFEHAVLRQSSWSNSFILNYILCPWAAQVAANYVWKKKYRLQSGQFPIDDRFPHFCLLGIFGLVANCNFQPLFDEFFLISGEGFMGNPAHRNILALIFSSMS